VGTCTGNWYLYP